jgi:hypothetical protein
MFRGNTRKPGKWAAIDQSEDEPDEDDPDELKERPTAALPGGESRKPTEWSRSQLAPAHRVSYHRKESGAHGGQEAFLGP